MVDVLERGNLFVLYRPKVEETSPEGLTDVQRLYLVMKPQGKDNYRRIVIGQKKLPEIKDGGRKYWGFVDTVGSAEDVHEELERETYETETRGERLQPAARPAGEGVYAIVRHEDHTHFAYALELPDEPGEVQEAINLEDEASYVISIKNPEKGSPAAVGLSGDRQADFPEDLQEKFEDRRFVDADPPDFLDHEGAEVLLIGAAEDVKEELGLDLKPQDEDESTAEILNDLRLRKAEHPREPLLKGKWQ